MALHSSIAPLRLVRGLGIALLSWCGASCGEGSNETVRVEERAGTKKVVFDGRVDPAALPDSVRELGERARRDFEAADGIGERAIRDDEVERWLVVKHAVLDEVGPPSQDMGRVRAWNEAKAKHCSEQRLAEVAYTIIEGRMLAAKMALGMSRTTGSVPPEIRTDVALYEKHQPQIEAFDNELRAAASAKR